MMRHLILLFGASAALVCAQQPPISNADLRQASAANGLDAAIRTAAGSVPGPRGSVMRCRRFPVTVTVVAGMTRAADVDSKASVSLVEPRPTRVRFGSKVPRTLSF